MQEGKYPIMMEGEVRGFVEIRTKGALTEVEAHCRMTDELVRLSLYGENSEGYLGVMAPEGEELYLKKSLSRTACRAYPEEIIEAGFSGAGRAHMMIIPEEAEADPEQCPETADPAPQTRGPDIKDGPLDWYASPDGALVCFDGEKNLLALPVGDKRIPPTQAGQPRSIEGREYLVFAAKSAQFLG